ncbi:MAG: 3-isopropylmalate dehydratase small subunit [Actinomycetota bacterium]|jgi:3-isopropylmalate/(R)-2-methylmalate dehydratase small subunit|nr:3-isopropylmalate dehydratase small subunit [Actinomycetota bacterium]MDD5600322.1 3-isopropylmalate dehydratase small subunit [Actinomycetota bacterium]
MIIKERVIKYGDNVNTDVIIPARYLNTTDENELALHCFEDLDSDFAEKAKERKIIVAGSNFGCGSSREHAPLAIKASGIKAVIAESFARIFFRNAINIGLPVITSGEVSDLIEDGDELEVDLSGGTIKDITKNKTFEIQPFPDFIQGIIKSGGYVNFTRDNIKGK